MKPAPFAYDDPTTVAEAAAILSRHGDEAKALAGGQSLVPMLALRLARFERHVDLNRIAELQAIERVDGKVRIGSMVRQSVAERDTTIATDAPLLARALPHIGHFQIRNRGTIGGSIAHADPASELPAVALALDAELEIARAGATRKIAASEFFLSMWTTVVQDDELLVAVHVPVRNPRSGFAIEELARRHGDFAIAGVACSVSLGNDGSVERAAIGMFGLGPTPLRAAAAEGALSGQLPTELDLDEVANLAMTDAEPFDDIHATSEYRRAVGAHLTRTALQRALEEASNG
jgi:carbon-monoxide dehydrogenase medium subunit